MRGAGVVDPIYAGREGWGALCSIHKGSDSCFLSMKNAAQAIQKR